MGEGDTSFYGVIDKKTGKHIAVVGSKEESDNFINVMKVKVIIRECFDLIKEVLEKYVVLKEEYYNIISLWIIGTYLHKEFESYPYLFLNAMRGSGKTRTLKLITSLSFEGEVLASPTEAVLFRCTGTLGIDEFEGIGNKDKSSLRELLNAGYKKGIVVKRLKRKKTLKGEEQVVESFEPYRPVVMANIWGMEEVLSDRCISLVLEKSDDPLRTKLIEDFSSNKTIGFIRKNLNQCRLCSDVLLENIQTTWNNYIINKYKKTLNTLTSYNTITTQTTQQLIKKVELDQLFNKIEESQLYGRNLELFLPLFLISWIINKETLEKTLEIAKKVSMERTHEEEVESPDVMLLDFICQQEPTLQFHNIKGLTDSFRSFIDEPGDWLNTHWFGRALKRLDLVVDKKRTNIGRQVILNVKKAQEKIKMFKKKPPRNI
jgi:hypothetical protein